MERPASKTEGRGPKKEENMAEKGATRGQITTRVADERL